MNDFINVAGGRKFLLCVGCGAVTSVLLWFGKLESGAYATIILGTVGAFIVGNVAAPEEGRRLMRASPIGVDIIKAFESCRLTAYPDPKTGGAPWTVGWGATGPGLGPGTVWTQQQADTRLALDIAEREEIVAANVRAAMTQGQFDAMVSIVFNVGPGSKCRDGIIRLQNGQPSTLLRLLNAGDYDGCAEQFMRWVSPGTSVENGLRRRRTAERQRFLA